MTDEWETEPRPPGVADVIRIREGLVASERAEEILLLTFALAALGRDVLKGLAEHANLLSELDPENDVANDLADHLVGALELVRKLDETVEDEG